MQTEKLKIVKDMQTTHLTKDLYLEHIKESPKTQQKKMGKRHKQTFH